MLADAKAKVARLGEVALAQLVLLDLEATLENLLGLGAADGDVHGNLFVPSDAECADCVAGLAWSRVSESCRGRSSAARCALGQRERRDNVL